MSKRATETISLVNKLIEQINLAAMRAPTNYGFEGDNVVLYWDHPKPEEARTPKELKISFAIPPDYLVNQENRGALIANLKQNQAQMTAQGFPDYMTKHELDSDNLLWPSDQRPINCTYEQYLAHVYTKGVTKSDRTGTGTKSVFGHQMRFDLSEGFPLVTTKKVHLKSIIVELLWFLRGDTNTKFLKDNGVTIWDEWADEEGNLGPVYGSQWRSWPTFQKVTSEQRSNYGAFVEGQAIDQISEVIDALKTNPDSRRIIVSAWNVADLPEMALPPCHAFFQFYTEELDLVERGQLLTDEQSKWVDLQTELSEKTECELFNELGIPQRKLSCQLYQRSVDSAVGLPFNVASYSLLVLMIAQQVNMTPGDFVWTGGDCHIYSNHYEQVEEQLSRQPYPFPVMKINRKPDSIFDYNLEDFELVGYQHHPAIKMPVAV